MTDDTIPLFSFPAIEGKKVTAAFDGGRLSSDGGVMLLSMAERRLGVAQRLARCIPDRRDPSRIAHTIADMIRARVFAICCGYEDADDLDDGERLWTDLRVWAYRGEIVPFRGEPRVGRTGWTSSRRADGCRPTVRCERPCERAARQLIRRKAPRNQRCIIYFVRGRGGIDMQTPVDIAFRHCEPSEEIRSEIAAQVQRLEKFSPRITSCRVVVTGPQTGHRRGGFEVELRIAMPDHNKVVVDKSHADAPEREHALVAIREAFDAAVRQIENVMREFRGQVKHHAEASHGRVKNLLAREDCGFIETADGRQIYFHRNAVLEAAFDRSGPRSCPRSHRARDTLEVARTKVLKLKQAAE